MKECEKAVEKLWGLEPPDTVEDIPPGQMPVDMLFLIVDPGATRRDLVAQGMRAVLGRFPWLIMVLLTGEQLPTDEELAAWQLTDVLKLVLLLGGQFLRRHNHQERCRPRGKATLTLVREVTRFGRLSPPFPRRQFCPPLGKPLAQP